MSNEKLVVIEDEQDILDIITYNLEREGYKVFSSRDGNSGLKLVRDQDPNLVLLDLMLPGMDGLDICRSLKGDPLTNSIPVIMLTAKSEESDVVLGLGLGADDYITKPFSTKELIARVKAVLRRGPLRDERSKGERIVIEGLLIDAGKHQVFINGEQSYFTATEFRMLYFLASHPGRVFTRDQLLNRVIGEDATVIDRNIDVHIRSIRKKLGDQRNLIETIRGVGYRFMDSE